MRFLAQQHIKYSLLFARRAQRSKLCVTLWLQL